MTINIFNFDHVDPSWQDCLKQGLQQVNPAYLGELAATKDWLPGPDKIFNAFALPVDKVNYVLFGESPYPRAVSANGYAFWDAAVKELWSPTGLSKQVNRATSLRNILKMLLVAEGLLPPDHTQQTDIANLDKKHLIQTNHELFNNLLQHGFLLLNATPVLRPHPVKKEADYWQPFQRHILQFLLTQKLDVQFILLGNIANQIDKLIPADHVKKLYAEHPYNLSFIDNPKILAFFQPLHLLLTLTPALSRTT